MIRKEARVLGIDDAPFARKSKKNVLVVGVIHRGGNYFDGVISTKVRNDGLNSTSKLIEMVNKSKFKKQLRLIMLDGIALAGFNIVDINLLNKKTKVPVMVVIRKKPDLKKILKALSYMGQASLRKELIEKAGEVRKIGKVYCQLAGLDKKTALEFLKITTIVGNLPEPLRTAHIIARGVEWGESVGRA